jgi:hypothetical protein
LFIRVSVIFSSPRRACSPPLDFFEAMAGAGVKIEGVEPFQVLNTFQGIGAEGGLAVESMEHYAFEQVAQRHVVIFRESLEHFEKTFFHAHARLHAFNEEL